MADRPLTYRNLFRILRTYGVFEESNRGKGSERMLMRIVDGHPLRIPTRCHNEGDEKPRDVIRSIRRRLKLTEADGVTDREFYSR